MSKGTDLRAVIAGLTALHRAEEAEEEARERRATAAIHLAEMVDVGRRDKDTGFEAEMNAKDLIVKAALVGELVPVGDQPEQQQDGGEA